VFNFLRRGNVWVGIVLGILLVIIVFAILWNRGKPPVP